MSTHEERHLGEVEREARSFACRMVAAKHDAETWQRRYEDLAVVHDRLYDAYVKLMSEKKSTDSPQ